MMTTGGEMSRKDSTSHLRVEHDFGLAIGWNLHVPYHLFACLRPPADDMPIGRVVAHIHMVAIGNRETRTEPDVLVGIIRADAAQILVTPGEQIAQQHDVVATVHRRIGRVAIP